MERGKGFLVMFICLGFLSTACLVLRRKPEDIEEILPCSFVSNPLIISEKKGFQKSPRSIQTKSCFT